MVNKNIEIVLSGTLKSGNIGSVARAMNNMGFCTLKLVNPQCSVDDQAMHMATHGKDILKNVQIFTRIRDAVESSSYIFGTTARSRKHRNTILPEEMDGKIQLLAQGTMVSILFGPEDRGLSNEEIELCNDIVTIPTLSAASSLNISHAVMLICYAIFRSVNKITEISPAAQLAPSEKTEPMYEQMQSILLDAGFLNKQNPKPVMGMFREILTRANLTISDVKLIRGVIRQLRWFMKR